MTNPSRSLNAITTRYILIGLCVIMIIGIGAVSVLAQHILTQKAIEIDHVRTDTILARDEIVKLKQLQKTLEDDHSIVQKTAEIVAQSQMYTYQNQIISDLSDYAAQSGVSVIGYDFTGKQSPVAQGLPAKTVIKVRLKDQTPYISYLRFLKAIEGNVMKMQLTSIDLTPFADDYRLLQEPQIELEVFLQ